MTTPSASLLDLLDRLDRLLASPGALFGPRRAARGGGMRRLVAELRALLTQELDRQVARAQSEAEAVLRRAQDEARRIVLEAEDRARRALQDGPLARAAELQLRHLREEAAREAEETRRGADQYALEVLDRLEQEVTRILGAVRRGKAILVERGRAPARAGEEAQPAPSLDNEKMASV
jgi:vacuolar-type H+-ATPase subunit H